MNHLGIIERARKLLERRGFRTWKQAAKRNHNTDHSHEKFNNIGGSCIPIPVWMETEAIVTECSLEPSKTESLSLASTKEPGNMMVHFTYYAHARTYYDHFTSPVMRTQGELFPVFYNALNPQHNTLSPTPFVGRCTVSEIDVLGFVLLTVLFLIVVHK